MDNSQAQSALNVEASVTGTAIVKRGGYARTFSLTVASSPVNGSFSFVDPNGNRQDIVCHDHYCAKSTNGAAFTNWLSSGGVSCLPTRWSFTQINGTMYGANDCRDPILSYDGTTLSYPLTMPRAAVVEATKDRLSAGDIQGNPGQVAYSQSGVATNFTTGLNSADPYTDAIGSQGDRVIALRYALGRLFVFKTSSITACFLKDQYTSSCYPISGVIGTNDPNSVIETPGAILFKGQDRNFWKLDQNGVTPISMRISNLIKSQNSGSTQSNTQTTKADWQAGTQNPTSSWDTTTSAGSIFPSSVTLTENTTTQFAAGTLVNTSTAITNRVILIQGLLASFTNAGSESNNYINWSTRTTVNIAGGFDSIADATMYGSRAWKSHTASGSCAPYGQLKVDIYSPPGTLFYTNTFNITGGLGVQTVTVNMSTVAANMAQVVFTENPGGLTVDEQTSVPFIRGTGFTFKYKDMTGGCVPGFDIDETNIITSGTYTTQRYDTRYSTPTWGPFTATISSGAASDSVYSSASSITFQTQVSATSNGTLDAPVQVANGGKITSAQKEFILSVASFSVISSTNTPPYITSESLTAATTGVYQTQCIQAGNPTTAWGLLNCAQTLAGAGSLVYYATSAVTCAAMPTTAPTAWTSVNNNATLSIAVSSAVTIGFRSLLGSATDQAQIDACTIYWTNGTASPPAWGIYDPLKNSVYWSIAINNSAQSNRILKYDLNLNEWFPFGLNANALLDVKSVIYFGDSTGGYWNQFAPPGVNSDNGAAINSYWVSKDFGGGTPFQDKQFNAISLITKNQTTGNMTVTYTTSDNSQNSYTVSLSTTSGAQYVHANKRLGLLSPQQFINVQLGNNSTTPWEVDGLGVDMQVFPWKAQNP